MRFKKAIDFIENELRTGTFPGAGLLVVRKGEQLLDRYWGTYCSQTQRNVDLDASVHHMLYSFSKGISATAIVIAHQRKLIDYDVPISTYLLEYRGKWKDLITIRKLLTHASGIPNCPLESVYTSELWQKGIDLCCATPVEWEPGSKTEYHGSSAMFLAAAATRRMMGNATWENICRELVFDPIGAKSLTFLIPQGVPVALTVQPKEMPAAIDTISPWSLGQPGAGCFGRMEDMIRVLQLHLNRGVWEGKTIIQEAEFQEMHNIQYETQITKAEQAGEPRIHSPWGLGWMIRRHLGLDHWFGLGSITSPKTFGHAGIATVIGIGDPERQTALVFITTNSPEAHTVRVRQAVTNFVMSEIEINSK